MYAAGQKEMQQMDRYTIEKLGLPGVVLMENAGARVVEEILSYKAVEKPKVMILAGGGNNGGDGFVIARRLVDLGIETLLCLLIGPERLKGDALTHFNVYLKRGLPLLYFNENTLSNLQYELEQADLIVDAILGTGVNGPLREPLKTVISLVNEMKGKKYILSVDIPSGVSSDTGKVEGGAIQADKTITFVFPKKGFFLNDGPKYIGDWRAVDISVPPSLVSIMDLKLPHIITENLVKDTVPKRPKHGHKGTFGHALILGGSRNYVGAPIFSARAALHSGAGLVTLGIPEQIYPMAAAQNPESLFLPLSEQNGYFSEQALNELTPSLNQYDSIAIGPGMGRLPEGEKWIKSLLKRFTTQSLVIDADALYLLRGDLELLHEYQGDILLTPHPGEMARLVNKTIQEVEADRIEIARLFAEKYQVYLLLKGHRTIISTPQGVIYINPHGHDALGKGGSGDVLTGLIASFLAQGANPINALVSASYIHALSGEEQAKKLSNYGVTPVNLIDGIKEVLKRLV
ncbi:NAD(P)H-hydrate dehydratase [Neobacillus sp. LXY-1]|uniref:NAD(P)H-hydrate dehydratase n=1 Tax=Neobacillus sp. LXY-1 TaxID=3379133 RepID=UPI003EE29A96